MVLLPCVNAKAKIVLTTQNKFLRSSVNVERADHFRNKNPLLSEKTQLPGSCSATGLLDSVMWHAPDPKITFHLRVHGTIMFYSFELFSAWGKIAEWRYCLRVWIFAVKLPVTARTHIFPVFCFWDPSLFSLLKIQPTQKDAQNFLMQHVGFRIRQSHTIVFWNSCRNLGTFQNAKLIWRLTFSGIQCLDVMTNLPAKLQLWPTCAHPLYFCWRVAYEEWVFKGPSKILGKLWRGERWSLQEDWHRKQATP